MKARRQWPFLRWETLGQSAVSPSTRITGTFSNRLGFNGHYSRCLLAGLSAASPTGTGSSRGLRIVRKHGFRRIAGDRTARERKRAVCRKADSSDLASRRNADGTETERNKDVGKEAAIFVERVACSSGATELRASISSRKTFAIEVQPTSAWSRPDLALSLLLEGRHSLHVHVEKNIYPICQKGILSHTNSCRPLVATRLALPVLRGLGGIRIYRYLDRMTKAFNLCSLRTFL